MKAFRQAIRQPSNYLPALILIIMSALVGAWINSKPWLPHMNDTFVPSICTGIGAIAAAFAIIISIQSRNNSLEDMAQEFRLENIRQLVGEIDKLHFHLHDSYLDLLGNEDETQIRQIRHSINNCVIQFQLRNARIIMFLQEGSQAKYAAYFDLMSTWAWSIQLAKGPIPENHDEIQENEEKAFEAMLDLYGRLVEELHLPELFVSLDRSLSRSLYKKIG